MILALASLIFFVFNTGDQVNQSVMAQNAADSAALAGANWLAHGYNLLSANNVAASKIIAMIAMLEALPPAVRLALPNARDILPVIEHYPDRLPGRSQSGLHPDAILARALAGPVRPGDCDSLSDADCESLLDECRQCITKLEQIQAVIDRLDEQYRDRGGFPAALTAFDTGELWQVLRALQNFSNTIVAITPGMAQHRAISVGRGNWATAAVMLPIMPDFAVRSGEWGDYYDPVMSGLPANWDVAQAEVVKGGFHTRLLQRVGGYWPPYERRDAIEVPGRVGRETEELGEEPDERRGDPAAPRRWIPSSIMNWIDAQMTREQILAAAHGPFRTYRDDVVYGTWPEMRLSGFPIIFERTCRAVMNAVWNNVVTHLRVPRWAVSWNDATRLQDSGVDCAMSAWLGTRRNAHEMFAPGPDGAPPTSGPWRIDPWPAPPKNEEIVRGWRDHTRAARELEWVWYGQVRVRTFDPGKFGASPVDFPPDGYEPPNGGQPYWLFWRWRKWLFLGAMFDTDSFEMPNLQRLVGDKRSYFPYHLAPRGEFANRHEYGRFDVLAFACRPGWARMWGKALQNPSPFTFVDHGAARPVNLAYAQARVFNPTAWDLWTQDWRVKLVPASALAAPANQPGGVAAGLDAYAAFASDLTDEMLQPVHEFYVRLPADMAQEAGNH